MWMWSTGINRNIVECKENRLRIQIMSQTSINRNIVECKEPCKFNDVDNLFVLIETLWNVKIYIGVSVHRRFYVLIETLWNVKLIYGHCQSRSGLRY